MSDKTGIEWTDATWNPIRGCTRVSEGCRNCYAEAVARRFSGPGMAYEGLVRIGADGKPHEWNGAIKFVDSHLNDPLKWRQPKRIFVNSMSDLFHENVRLSDQERIWRTMCGALHRGHIFQILTKRPERMRGIVPIVMNRIYGFHWRMPDGIHLGTSCEDRATTDRIDALREVPAAVRFLSLEPLLEDIGPLNLAGIHWVIVGGESGPGARPCHTTWIREIVLQCQGAGVPCFVKQLGAHVIQNGERRIKRDRKGGDMDEWPHDIRIRQFPEAVPV